MESSKKKTEKKQDSKNINKEPQKNKKKNKNVKTAESESKGNKYFEFFFWLLCHLMFKMFSFCLYTFACVCTKTEKNKLFVKLLTPITNTLSFRLSIFTHTTIFFFFSFCITFSFSYVKLVIIVAAEKSH